MRRVLFLVLATALITTSCGISRSNPRVAVSETAARNSPVAAVPYTIPTAPQLRQVTSTSKTNEPVRASSQPAPRRIDKPWTSSSPPAEASPPSVPGHPVELDAGSIVSEVVTNGERAVAVGSACEGPATGRGHCVGAIWGSSDLHNWNRVGHTEELFGSPKFFKDASHLRDVAVTEEGFVAVGGVDSGLASTVLFSRDGRQWARVALPSPGYAEHVVGSRAGFVMAGTSIWHSSDGHTWSIAESDAPHAQVSDLSTNGDTYVAFAGEDVLTSNDGRAWSHHRGAVPTAETSDCSGGPRPVKLGELYGSADGYIVTQWSSAWVEGPAAIWKSQDGLAWQRIELPDSGDTSGTITALAVEDGRYTAFGIAWHFTDPDAGCPDPRQTGSVVWTSTNAEDWEVFDPESQFEGRRPREAWDVGKAVLVTTQTAALQKWDPPVPDGATPPSSEPMDACG